MKPRLSNQQTTALTLIEVLVSIAVLAVLWALLMPAMDNRPMSATRIACVSKLKKSALLTGFGKAITVINIQWQFR
jgi:Tfp pilus assembly protein FimT